MRFCSKSDVYFNFYNMHKKPAEHRKNRQKCFAEDLNLISP